MSRTTSLKNAQTWQFRASPRSTRSRQNCRRFLPAVGIGSGRLSSSDSSSSTLQKIRWSFDRWLLSSVSISSQVPHKHMNHHSMWVLFSSPQKLTVIPRSQSSSMLHHAKLKVICIPKLGSKLPWFWLCTGPPTAIEGHHTKLASRPGFPEVSTITEKKNALKATSVKGNFWQTST